MKVGIRKPEGKRPLGRLVRRREDNNEMYLKEVGCQDGNWIGLGQDRNQWWAHVNMAMKPFRFHKRW
jgi:hypothetical protein